MGGGSERGTRQVVVTMIQELREGNESGATAVHRTVRYMVCLWVLTSILLG